MEKEVVRELLGYSVNRRNILNELIDILPGGKRREVIIADYKLLKEKLGPAGASGRIAKDIIENVRKNVEVVEEG
jgi:lipid-A-disaccharide synthase